MFALVHFSTELGRRRRRKDCALEWLKQDCVFITDVLKENQAVAGISWIRDVLEYPPEASLPLPWIVFLLGATCGETASLKFCFWKLPLYRFNLTDLSNLVQRPRWVFLYPWVWGRDCAGVWVWAFCKGLQCQSCNSHPCSPGAGGNKNASSKWTAFLDIFLLPGWNLL